MVEKNQVEDRSIEIIHLKNRERKRLKKNEQNPKRKKLTNPQS